LTRNFYLDDDVKKVVNDSDSELYQIYKHPEKYMETIDKFREICNKHKNENGNVLYKDFIEEFDKEEVFAKKFIKQERIVRGTMVKVPPQLDREYIINIHSKIEFYNENWRSVVDRHSKDKDAFIFIDPPYLFSDNSAYEEQNEEMDMTKILYEVKEIMEDKKTKCKIMMIINDLAILRYLYKEFIKGSYQKTYQIGKRKCRHLIICNY
jgi:hypothetical protein